MKIASPGHVAFSLAMIGIGLMGLIEGKFTAIWLPVPSDLPFRTIIAHLCAVIALGAGVGLFFRRTAGVSAAILFAYLLIWMLAFKGPFVVKAPLEEGSYQSIGENAVWVAAAWTLWTWFAGQWEKSRLGFLAGDPGLRLARILYGGALIAFGLSHFVYLNLTAPIIPDFLPWHVGLAYFTGAAYFAAGVAIIVGIFARLAAALVAVQIALISALVWVPVWIAGPKPSHWAEIIVSIVLTAGAWVIADSYRGASWLPWPRRTAA